MTKPTLVVLDDGETYSAVEGSYVVLSDIYQGDRIVLIEDLLNVYFAQQKETA